MPILFLMSSLAHVLRQKPLAGLLPNDPHPKSRIARSTATSRPPLLAPPAANSSYSRRWRRQSLFSSPRSLSSSDWASSPTTRSRPTSSAAGLGPVAALPDVDTEDEPVQAEPYAWMKTMVREYNADGVHTNTVKQARNDFGRGFSDCGIVFTLGEILIDDTTYTVHAILDYSRHGVWERGGPLNGAIGMVPEGGALAALSAGDCCDEAAAGGLGQIHPRQPHLFCPLAEHVRDDLSMDARPANVALETLATSPDLARAVVPQTADLFLGVYAIRYQHPLLASLADYTFSKSLGNVVVSTVLVFGQYLWVGVGFVVSPDVLRYHHRVLPGLPSAILRMFLHPLHRTADGATNDASAV
uniref:Uncharacterized protein n=1 Tax=Mycena chlorophos TaxID=658473 RepID=A0ABQ0LUX1_MYCCL|nr:predicted protein [Mycena chlorophos]